MATRVAHMVRLVAIATSNKVNPASASKDTANSKDTVNSKDTASIKVNLASASKDTANRLASASKGTLTMAIMEGSEALASGIMLILMLREVTLASNREITLMVRTLMDRTLMEDNREEDIILMEMEEEVINLI